VALNSKTDRVAHKTPLVKRNLAGKKPVGMRRSRESNPALITEGGVTRGTKAQVPGDCVPVNLQRSSARVFVNRILTQSKMKRALAFPAQFQALQGESM